MKKRVHLVGHSHVYMACDLAIFIKCKSKVIPISYLKCSL
jgi:hypothetical protein